MKKKIDEQAAVALKKEDPIERYLQMSPKEFASLSQDEISDILNDILPGISELSKQLEQLEWIFEQLKDNRLLKEVKKFKDNALRYRNVLVTLAQQSYADPRKILKRLEEENPKLSKLIEKIKEEETVTIDKVRKAYSKDRMRPKGYPDKPEKVMTESLKTFITKGWDKIKGIWGKISDEISKAWLSLFGNLNADLEKMTDEISLKSDLRTEIRRIIEEMAGGDAFFPKFRQRNVIDNALPIMRKSFKIVTQNDKAICVTSATGETKLTKDMIEKQLDKVGIKPLKIVEFSDRLCVFFSE